MNVTIEKNEIVIRVPLQKPQPSGSGKSLIVATSAGIVTTSATVDGKPVKIGLNCFIAKD
jgi:hypothetical protein